MYFLFIRLYDFVDSHSSENCSKILVQEFLGMLGDMTTSVFRLTVCWIAILGFSLSAEPNNCKGTSYLLFENFRNMLFNVHHFPQIIYE